MYFHTLQEQIATVLISAVRTMQSRLARSFARGPLGVHWKSQQARHAAVVKRFSSFPSFFPPSQKDLIESEKAALASLADILKSLDSDPAQVKLIQETRSRLDDIFMLVVVGEFNSGKSTFINALLGHKVLKEGVLPTTEKICVLRHQELRTTAGGKGADADYEELFLNEEFLKNVALVDTPGTNGLIEKHAKLTEEVIPRSDLIIFVTSAERPLSESETLLLSQICSWNRKVIVVLNKMDITKEQDKGMLIDYVSQNVARVVGNINIEPVRVFPVSGRQALDAFSGMSRDSVSGSRVQLLRNSNIEELKSYLSEVLSHKNIVREKLLNPLRMMDSIILRLGAKLAERESLIEGDERTIEFIEENIVMFAASIREDAQSYKKKIKHQHDQMRSRCLNFVNNELSPLNIATIVSPAALAAKFKTEVLLDMTGTLEEVKAEHQDFLRKRTIQQHRSVMQYVSDRVRQHQSKIMGSLNVLSDDDASGGKNLMGMDRDISLLLSEYSPIEESTNVTKPVSLVAMASVVSAVGGVVGSGLIWVTGMDVLLCAATTAIGIAGVSAYSWKRNALRDTLNVRLDDFQNRLDVIMGHYINEEITRAENKINDSIRAYVTFVELEKKRIIEMRASLDKVSSKVNDIKSKI